MMNREQLKEALSKAIIKVLPDVQSVEKIFKHLPEIYQTFLKENNFSVHDIGYAEFAGRATQGFTFADITSHFRHEV